MSVRFLHIADTHLGIRQYHRIERMYDFSNAFYSALIKGIEHEVDFILLAGDLFNNADISPEALTDVCNRITQFRQRCLEKLNREIPLIVIEGNHDYQEYNTENSWLQFLAGLGFIILLAEKYNASQKKILFEPYNQITHKGGMLKIKNACIYGVHYRGSITNQFFPLIYDAISKNPNESTILMMHFGIEGQVSKRSGEQLSDALLQLHEKVDYLALGHFHKQYFLPENDPWIFNPGSLEIVDASDFYEQAERGAFLVTLTPNSSEKMNFRSIYAVPGGDETPFQISTRKIIPILDPILVGEENESTFEQSTERIIDSLTKFGLSPKGEVNLIQPNQSNLPILFITLKGTLTYSKLEFNTIQLRTEILDRFELLECRIYPLIDSVLDNIQLSAEEKISPDEIENRIFTTICDQTPIYKPFTSELVPLISQIKTLMLKPKPNVENVKNTVKEWYFDHFLTDEEKTIVHELSPSSEKINVPQEVNLVAEENLPDYPAEIPIKKSSSPKGKKKRTIKDYEN